MNDIDTFFLRMCKTPAAQMLFNMTDGRRVEADGSAPLSLLDTQTVADALQFFELQRITGAPVINQFGLYVGWMSLHTLISEALTILATESHRHAAWTLTRINQFQLWTESASPLNDSASMALTLEMCANQIFRKHGLVLVSDTSKMPFGVITTSAWIKFLGNAINAKQLPSFAAIKLGDVKGGTSSVVSVNEHEKALNGFQKLIEFDISGAVVVSDSGQAIDMISQRDFYALGKASISFRRFQQPICVFKAESRRKHAVPDAPGSFVSLTRESTVADAIHVMMTRRVARVCIVSDQSSMVPVDVITQHDILAKLVANFRDLPANA